MFHNKKNIFFKNEKTNLPNLNSKIINFSKGRILKKRDPYKQWSLVKPIYIKDEYKKKQPNQLYSKTFRKINFKQLKLLKKEIKRYHGNYLMRLRPWEFQILKAQREAQRRVKRGLTKIIISESENNVFGVVSTIKGKILISSSTGKMRVKKRKTQLSVDLLGQALAKHLIARALIFYELIFIGKLSRLMKSMLRGLKKVQNRTRLICKRIKIITIIAHNGVRLKVAPRK